METAHNTTDSKMTVKIRQPLQPLISQNNSQFSVAPGESQVTANRPPVLLLPVVDKTIYYLQSTTTTEMQKFRDAATGTEVSQINVNRTDSSTQTEPDVFATMCCTHHKTAEISSPSTQNSNMSVTSSQASDGSDKTYDPYTDSDGESEVDVENLTTKLIGAQSCDSDTKYIVFESQLTELFKFCPICGSAIISSRKCITGTMVTVHYTCQGGHNNKWYSSPILHHMSASNLLLSAAILLSGSTYTTIDHLFNILHLPHLGEREFYRIQKSYLCPVINDYWTMHQSAILSVLCENEIMLCGDARSDSPGFSAKYTSYTMMDMSTSLIVDQQLVVVSEVNSSVAMEREGIKRSLEFLISHGLKIDTLATDRHVAVQKLMQTQYPDINHQFDVWHVSKNITKKLHRKGLKRDTADLMPWIHSVSNHLYWSAETCNRDPQLLKEKWMSCIYHIANIHEWSGDQMVKCEHDNINDDDIAWLAADSPAHKALKDVVLNKQLLKDIEKLNGFCQTGQLEVYHSMLLKYAPKRQHFHYEGMQARLQLAALDHNHNVDRELATDSSGKCILRQVFTKARKNWIVRNVKETKEYSFIDDIVCKVVNRRLDRTIHMNDGSSYVVLPVMKNNIATVEKPTLEEALKNRYSRSQRHEL